MKRPGLLDSHDPEGELEVVCRARGLSPDVLRTLVHAVRSRAGQLRRRGLFDQFDATLDSAHEGEAS